MEYQPVLPEAPMDVRLMGNVEIRDGSHSISLPRAGERCVLACLALEAGRRVHVDVLVDRLWGDDPPTGAWNTITSYVRTVRKALETGGGRREWLRSHRPATYQLHIDPDLVDYHRFAALVTQARTMQRDGKPADAAALYQRALALRAGEALGDVTGQWAANRRYAIEQEHLDAVCALYEQQLSIGDYAAVATHGTHLVMDVVPTDRMIVLSIHGLARSGQHATIPSFLSRVSRRMRETAQAVPGPEVLAIARQLIANPDAELRPPGSALVGAQRADQPVEDGAEEAGTATTSAMDGGEPPAREATRGSVIVLTAEHNQQVYQAAGDQYIAGT
jgi:DNA-binding SARP family transcriptional activator